MERGATRHKEVEQTEASSSHEDSKHDERDSTKDQKTKKEMEDQDEHKPEKKKLLPENNSSLSRHPSRVDEAEDTAENKANSILDSEHFSQDESNTTDRIQDQQETSIQGHPTTMSHLSQTDESQSERTPVINNNSGDSLVSNNFLEQTEASSSHEDSKHDERDKIKDLKKEIKDQDEHKPEKKNPLPENNSSLSSHPSGVDEAEDTVENKANSKLDSEHFSPDDTNTTYRMQVSTQAQDTDAFKSPSSSTKISTHDRHSGNKHSEPKPYQFHYSGITSRLPISFEFSNFGNTAQGQQIFRFGNHQNAGQEQKSIQYDNHSGVGNTQGFCYSGYKLSHKWPLSSLDKVSKIDNQRNESATSDVNKESFHGFSARQLRKSFRSEISNPRNDSAISDEDKDSFLGYSARKLSKTFPKNHTKVYEKVKSKPENENTEKAETEKMKSAESAQINPKLNEYQCTQPSNEDVDGSKRHVKQLEETLEKVNLENTSLKNLEKDLKAKTLQLENDVRMSSDENKLLQEKITKNVETLLERTEDFFSEKRAKENAVRAALKCAQQEQNFQKVVLQKENEISSLKELNRQVIRRQEIIFHWRILLSAVIRRKRVKMSNAIFLERLSEIQAEKNNLAEELSTKVAEINELNETIEKLEGMKKTLETECLEKSFLVSHKEGQVQIAHEWAQRMGQEYTENQIRQSQLERELSATLKELKTNQEHYSHLMGAYTSREIELVKLQTEVERQVQQNALAQENLKKAERITEEIKTKNIQLKEEINKGMIEREREYERKEDIKKKEQANRRCLKEITSLRSQVERLKTENQRLRNKSHQLEDELFGRIRESTHSSPDSISYLDEGLYRHSFFNADDSAGDDPSF